jgi:hypothetical protein
MKRFKSLLFVVMIGALAGLAALMMPVDNAPETNSPSWVEGAHPLPVMAALFDSTAPNAAAIDCSCEQSCAERYGGSQCESCILGCYDAFGGGCLTRHRCGTKSDGDLGGGCYFDGNMVCCETDSGNIECDILN